MEYVPVRINTLRAQVPLLFDVYINYKDTYLKYKATEQIFEEELLKKFQSKKIKKVYVLAEQEPLYLKYLESALDQLSQANVNSEQKAIFAQEAMKTESENIGKNLESEEAYKSTENRIMKVVDFISGDPKSLVTMLSSAGVSVDSSEHSSSVSTLSLSVASKLRITDKEELMAIAVAALVHDMGLKELGFTDPSISIDDLKGEERSNYRKHPQIAVDQVAGKRYITPRVLRLIEDHEEYGEGLGYPEKKRITKLSQSSQIFNMCDAFDHFCIKQKKLAVDVFDDFVAAHSEHYELESMQALEKLIKGV